ncbi:unnamed protein product [Prunus brigantina]
MKSTIHILQDCPFARGVWTSSSLGGSRAQSLDQGIHDWFLCCSENLPHVVFELFLSIGWAIWEARNDKLWNNKNMSPDRIIHGTDVRLSDFARVHAKHDAGSIEGGVGIVVRDSKDYFVTGRALHVDNIYSTQVEAIAARKGAMLAVEKGFTNFVFKSDSLQIISALRTTTTDWSFIGPIVKYTKSMMPQNTREVFTHIHRIANMVADLLARFGWNISTAIT